MHLWAEQFVPWAIVAWAISRSCCLHHDEEYTIRGADSRNLWALTRDPSIIPYRLWITVAIPNPLVPPPPPMGEPYANIAIHHSPKDGLVYEVLLHLEAVVDLYRRGSDR